MDLEAHIDALRALMLETSPGSPTTSGHRSASNLKLRELLEQRVVTEFN